MVSKKVMRFPGKVTVQRYSSLCFGKSYSKAVGSKAYVQFTTFVTYSAINEGCICTCKSLMESVWCIGHR